MTQLSANHCRNSSIESWELLQPPNENTESSPIVGPSVAIPPPSLQTHAQDSDPACLGPDTSASVNTSFPQTPDQNENTGSSPIVGPSVTTLPPSLQIHAQDSDPACLGPDTSASVNTSFPQTPDRIAESTTLVTTEVPEKNIRPTQNFLPNQTNALNAHAELDLANLLPHFYRVLDLINEQSSSGLVDKIIISQDGLERFINDVSPGAYTSLTKVDFKELDRHSVRPVGVYGDQSEIIGFLSSMKLIDDSTAKSILSSKQDGSGPCLRSGIYIVGSSEVTSVMYAVYWPQEETWMDSAPEGVRRNRTTFMRYLSKIADQLMCFMSPVQGKAFVWEDEDQEKDDYDDADSDIGDGSDEGSDRHHKFRIRTTNEQKENVTAREGFSIRSTLLKSGSSRSEGDICPSPQFLLGETCQGFLSVKVIPPKFEEKYSVETCTPIRLRHLLTHSTVKIDESLDRAALQILIENNLDSGVRQTACTEWQLREDTLSRQLREMEDEEIRQLAQEYDEPTLRKQLMGYLIAKVLDKYPGLVVTRLSGDLSILSDELPELKANFVAFVEEFAPEMLFHSAFDRFLQKLGSFPKRYKDQKERILAVRTVSQKCGNLSEGDLRLLLDRGIKAVRSIEVSPRPVTYEEVKSACDRVSDQDFLARPHQHGAEQPLVQSKVNEAIRLGYSHIKDVLATAVADVMKTLPQKRMNAVTLKLRSRLKSHEEKERKQSVTLLAEALNHAAEAVPPSHPVIIIKHVRETSGLFRLNRTYEIKLTSRIHIDSAFEYTVHKLDLRSEHRHNLQLDPYFVPTPFVSQKDAVSFRLHPQCQVLHAQLLQNDRLLLIVDDKPDSFSLYLDHLVSIGDAIRHDRPKRTFHKDRIGQDLLVTFDESTRLLVLCAPSRLILHVFEFDQQYDTLRLWTGLVELSKWYDAGAVTRIEHICSVPGKEQVLLVNATGLARIWSFQIQQFLPPKIQLLQKPVSVLATPDGACALLVFQNEGERTLRAYHWETFGPSAPGISIAISEPQGSISVTSFVHRHHVHFLMMNESDGRCSSLALDITKKHSEFMFERQGAQTSEPSKAVQLVNNCLIDCFLDVWTRFPVVAAMSRQNITSSTTVQSQSITFFSDRAYPGFAAYFLTMVKKFENQTKKPGRKQLKAISIHTKAYHEALDWHLSDISLSSYRTGEWLVNLLCLIPIHLAVARNNCFVPLKDGVISAEFEQSLLGADVRRIVDSLSFGWYESIFRSYLVNKPVRVVSSMGEQSVGKSYSLNHLMDTSFAGSAMRTTEGVWMAITPTENEILVALDFEGVHSIERSPQEDALLVLFNTAISNLVLFRNNFALSRDITNLFQSFQASSKMLDPDANPTLFQSTLVIIVKDVGESDKREIVKEFELRFQRIVHDEKGANFITKLHAGNLDIIPWPVIESNKFYSTFNLVKRTFGLQPITHPSAGEFLHTMKLLMAKLKNSDWSAMSQSLAMHRVQSLLAFLPVALEYGAAEIEPAFEPLKSFDDDAVIDSPDTSYRLLMSTQALDPDVREAVLNDLKLSWTSYYLRHNMAEAAWITGLGNYLRSVADQRIAHVKKWISTNLERFSASNADIDMFYRQVEGAIVEVLGNIELCKATCSDCHISCTLSRRHDPIQQPHDCGTDHHCPQPCDYNDDHSDGLRSCGSASGHDGPHFCAVNMHSCGIECIHKGQKGCQTDCINTIGHTGPHLCGARKHACGRPCDLQIRGLDGNLQYTCPETCNQSSDEAHEQHVCDTRMCPLKCCLCNRLCANMDHLHGLELDALHLCGEEHHCQEVCKEGICKIESQPQRIEATFSGRHESFQYTKIPAGQLDHDGQHVHTLDPSPFHYCEETCKGCGYFCTLPQNHSQQEHDTNHGSMSQTKWVIDGPEDSAIEVENHRFGRSDEGGPVYCNLVCQSLGRHVHIDYCRTSPPREPECFGPEHQHISRSFPPNPDKPKDWTSHALYWRRSGFKDPYSQDQLTTFGKCDAMCPGKEHEGTATQAGQPSYCTLPIFHAPHATTHITGPGYVSSSGHLFSCINPALLQRAFHIMFVIDRSWSMSLSPPDPLLSTPVTADVISRHNNRLGAVYLSLHGFWSSRQATVSQAGVARRDAYSLVFFNHEASTCFVNDFDKTPEELLHTALQTGWEGGTSYEAAIQHTETVMMDNWSDERAPVVIFLTDGESYIDDGVMRAFCHAALRRGTPVSFHSIFFGTAANTTVVRRMVDIAKEVESGAPPHPHFGANSHVESSFAEALDSVQLSQTFLGIADSLTKLRGALIA